MALSLYLLLGVLIQAAGPQQQAAAISGTVIEADSGRAIPEARLRVTSSAGSVYSAVSDRDGKFLLSGLKPDSSVRLSVQALGYTAFESDAHPELPSLDLTANPKIADLRLELTPTGTISGRVLDMDGNPAAQITVQAVQPAYENGRMSWRVAQSRPANDLGEFRFFWLAPGRYYIRCLQADSQETFISSPLRTAEINEALSEPAPSVVRLMSNDGSIRDEGTFPVYYPGTPEPSMATPIDVRPGSHTAGIEFQFLWFPVHRIQGTIAGLPGQTELDRFVKLIPISQNSASQASGQNQFGATVEENGSFEISGVPEGSYLAVADVSVNSHRFSGSAPVEVHNSDVRGIVIMAGPNVVLSGRFRMDGELAGDPTVQVFAEIRLRSDLMNEDFILGTIDGTMLNFTNVAAAVYSVEADNLSVRVSGRNAALPAYIESIKAGNQDVLQNGLHVTSPFDQTIDIVLGTEFARLSGRVTGSASASAFRSTIVLVPENRKDRSRYKSAIANRDGQFQLDAVAPGNYKLFAWDQVENGAWFNTQFLEEYESRGLPIAIAAGGNSATFQLISREPRQ